LSIQVSFMYSGCDVCIFFFQAEDGIRDKLVTGVQTCALPIFPSLQFQVKGNDGRPTLHSAGINGQLTGHRAKLLIFDDLIKSLRSEERRVGKECRSRWST